LIGYYSTQNKLHTVDGIGDIKDVTERLSNVIEKL
jgi:adenylate kinase